MTATLLSPLPKLRFVDSNGNALSGGKLFTYSAGTTTKLATYTDSTGGTPNTNPVILDTRGEASVWLTPGVAYKFTLSPSTDSDPPTNPIWTVDGISAIAAPSLPTFRGWLAGMTLSNDGTSPNTVLDISTGQATDSTNATLITLGAWTKATGGTWVAGSGQNGMGTGLTIANSTTYHVFAIINGGVSDVYFDTSPTAANAPAGTTAFRCIGSFLTDGSAHIVPFIQNGDRFDRATPLQEYSGTPGVTTAQTMTLAGVPTGRVVQALLSGSINDGSSAGAVAYISSLAQTDVAATASNFNIAAPGTVSEGSFNIGVMTNTSAQVRRRMQSATSILIVITTGWIDTRGRFS